MVMTDLTNQLTADDDLISTLLEDGMEQGYLTYDQILEVLPDIENNLPLLEGLLEEAQAIGVTVYETEEDALDMRGRWERSKGDAADSGGKASCCAAVRLEQRADRRFCRSLFPRDGPARLALRR